MTETTNDRTIRILIPPHGSPLDPVKTALGILPEVMERISRVVDTTLFLPSKQSLDSHKTIGKVLGSQVTKTLLANKPVRFSHGGNLILKTQITFREIQTDTIVLGVYVNGKMLNKMDDCGAPALIAVPWMEKEVEEWRRTWNPIILGEKVDDDAPKEEEPLIDNPVVEEALKSLTMMVNLSSGLASPSDRESAIQVFQILFSNNEHYDPKSIRAWALRNRWRPDGADELQAVAKAILDRRRLRGGSSKLWKSEIIQTWRADAKKSEQ